MLPLAAGALLRLGVAVVQRATATTTAATAATATAATTKLAPLDDL